MNAFFQMLNIQLLLIVYLCCGMICNKLDIINKNNQQQYVSLVLNILMPCMVFNSFKNITVSILYDSLLILLFSLFICLLSLIIGKFIYTDLPDKKRSVLRYATLINNAGFAGLPLVNAMYNETGLIYASVFLIPIRIFMWSAGLTMLTNERVNMKQLCLRLLKNPNIIAVLLGMLRGFMLLSLPAFLDSSITNLAACVSPLSMIMIGAIIADVPYRTLFEKGVLRYSLIRLIIIPLMVLIISSGLGLSSIIIGVSVILSGMPAATSTALLASQNGCDDNLASKLVLVSTLGSLITAPLLMLLI